MSLNSEQKLLLTAYNAMERGIDYIDALYDSRAILTHFTKEERRDNVLATAFSALWESFRVLSPSKEMLTLADYIDDEDTSNEDLFKYAVNLVA